MRFKDRIAIITGGTGALGKAVVLAFLEEGAKVVCTYIVDEELKHYSSLTESHKSNLVFIKADVTKEKSVLETVQKTLERFGGIDILVNIVGGFAYAKIVDTDEKTW